MEEPQGSQSTRRTVFVQAITWGQILKHTLRWRAEGIAFALNPEHKQRLPL